MVLAASIRQTRACERHPVEAHPTYGMQPLAPPGPAVPLGPPGMPPLAPPGPAVPPGPPGMAPAAPSGPAVAHAVPSGLTHPGGGLVRYVVAMVVPASALGRAEATGAAASTAAAAPARRTGVKEIFFSAIRLDYPHRPDLETVISRIFRFGPSHAVRGPVDYPVRCNEVGDFIDTNRDVGGRVF